MRWHYFISLLIALLIPLYITSSSNIYEYQVGQGEELSEEMALDLTKKALIDSGLDGSFIYAVPFHPGGSDLFARNTIDSNRGYVLWQKEGNDTKYAYIVYLERSEGQVTVTINEPK